jgi:hypothetical protein
MVLNYEHGRAQRNLLPAAQWQDSSPHVPTKGDDRARYTGYLVVNPTGGKRYFFPSTPDIPKGFSLTSSGFPFCFSRVSGIGCPNCVGLRAGGSLSVHGERGDAEEPE